jgi:hypothetical protein
MLKKIACLGFTILMSVPFWAEARHSGPSLSLSLGPAGGLSGYYVDATSGNDANDGRSPAAAWKTIAKVNGYSFSAGDRILFKRGEMWRETLTVPGDQLSFAAYGTGGKPILTGGDEFVGLAGNWTQETGVGTNIWSRPLTTECKTVIFIKTGASAYSYGTKESAAANLNAEYEWFWGANKLYVYATSNPATYFTSVEAAQRENTVYCERSNCTFTNILARNSGTSGSGDTWYFASAQNIVMNGCEGYFSSGDSTSNAITNHGTCSMTINDSFFGYCSGPVMALGGTGVPQTITMNRCLMKYGTRGFSGIAGGTYNLNRCWIVNCDNGLYNSGNLTVSNCLITNSSNYSLYFSIASDTVTLNNCTFYQPNGTYGIYMANGTLNMNNCIVYRAGGGAFRKEAAATYTGDTNCFYCDSPSSYYSVQKIAQLL